MRPCGSSTGKLAAGPAHPPRRTTEPRGALFYYRAFGFSGNDRRGRRLRTGLDPAGVRICASPGFPSAPPPATDHGTSRSTRPGARWRPLAPTRSPPALAGPRGGSGADVPPAERRRPGAFAPDGRVVSANADGALTVLDPASGASATLRGQHEQARELVVSPDGRTIASSDGGDLTLRLWDMNAALPRILIGDSRGDRRLAVDPGGNLVAGGGDAVPDPPLGPAAARAPAAGGCSTRRPTRSRT